MIKTASPKTAGILPTLSSYINSATRVLLAIGTLTATACITTEEERNNNKSAPHGSKHDPAEDNEVLEVLSDAKQSQRMSLKEFNAIFGFKRPPIKLSEYAKIDELSDVLRKVDRNFIYSSNNDKAYPVNGHTVPEWIGHVKDHLRHFELNDKEIATIEEAVKRNDTGEALLTAEEEREAYELGKYLGLL